MLTGECCDSERFANDIASGHDDEHFQISDCQNKVGISCSFVHALIMRKWPLQDFWLFMCDFNLTYNYRTTSRTGTFTPFFLLGNCLRYYIWNIFIVISKAPNQAARYLDF